MDMNAQLKLENQICFSLYATSKEVIRLYKPLLDEHGITYTQYLALMVIWEFKQVSVKQLGLKLHLDSGTLTPLLKKLASQGLVTRTRDSEDERIVLITPTAKGWQLEQVIQTVPEQISCQLQEVELDFLSLKQQLDTLLEVLTKA
ncbi:MAG: MarR family winged helix-turn-helix transcriptional regulator [Culicoidibacterales bacterium]